MIKEKTGLWGEVYAARYLRDNGYEILSSNYYCRFGEIDLIAAKGDMLCFAEVKTRKVGSYLQPREAVDEHKIRRMTLTAKSFISESKSELQPRFDVIEVWLGDEFALSGINLIENAFESEM